MATYSVQTIVASGIIPAYAAVAASDQFKIDSAQRHFLHVKNGGGGSINVTVNVVKTSANVPGLGQVTIEDIVVAVGAGAEKMIGPISDFYATAAGMVVIDYSGTSSVTAAAFRLG